MKHPVIEQIERDLKGLEGEDFLDAADAKLRLLGFVYTGAECTCPAGGKHGHHFACGHTPPAPFGGADAESLVGRRVNYFGRTWTIVGKNYLGDWDVERFEDRPDGKYSIKSSIGAYELPETHPHHVVLLPAGAVETCSSS